MNAIGIKTRQRKLVDGGCDGVCANCTAACDKSGEVRAK
jgi:electron transport complex protein RnfE